MQQGNPLLQIAAKYFNDKCSQRGHLLSDSVVTFALKNATMKTQRSSRSHPHVYIYPTLKWPHADMQQTTGDYGDTPTMQG